MRDDRSDLIDRRSGAGLRFDAEGGRLSLGAASVSIPPGAGNAAVLRAYVDLAARCRGDRVAELVELRQDDLDALAVALDLEAADLADQIEQVLGATSDQAVRFITRLREHRLVGGAAKVVAGAVLAGSLLAGAGAVAASARAEAPRAATAPSAADPATTTTTDMTAAGGWQEDEEPVIDGPVTTTPEGVGLIPPITEDTQGVVLIPPASVDRDPGAS